MSSEEKLRTIWSFKIKCPRCDYEFQVSEYMYEIPLVGKILISTGKCGECGYKYSDVRALESKGPQKLTLEVKSLEDLNALVIRASSATIKIPELGVEIKPGPASQGYITTVEGILDRVLQVITMLKGDPEVNEKERSKREELIRKAMEGKINFTLIIIDPEGVSRIVSDKAQKEKLYANYIV